VNAGIENTDADDVALAPEGVHKECRKHTFGVRFGTGVGDMAHHFRQSGDEAASTCTLRPFFFKAGILARSRPKGVPPERNQKSARHGKYGSSWCLQSRQRKQ